MSRACASACHLQDSHARIIRDNSAALRWQDPGPSPSTVPSSQSLVSPTKPLHQSKGERERERPQLLLPLHLLVGSLLDGSLELTSNENSRMEGRAILKKGRGGEKEVVKKARAWLLTNPPSVLCLDANAV